MVLPSYDYTHGKALVELSPLSLQVRACSLGSRLGEPLSPCMPSLMLDRSISLKGFGWGMSLLGHGQAMHVLSPAPWDETNSPCTCFLWVGSSLHAHTLFGWRLGPGSSPGGHWPIVCFFAKRWISISMVYCSFANLV